MTPIDVTLEANGEIFSLEYYYAKKLKQFITGEADAIANVILSFRRPCLGRIKSTNITFILDESLIIKVEESKMLKFFTRHEYILSRFGQDIYKFSGSSLTIEIIERGICLSRYLLDLFFFLDFPYFDNDQVSVDNLSLDEINELKLDIFCEIRDFSGNVLNRIVHKFPFNSWKTEFQKVYADLRTSYFNETEWLTAKIGSSLSMLDFEVINESDNSVKTIPTRISMNFLIYKKEFSSFNQLDTAFESELTAVGKRQRDFLIKLIQSNFPIKFRLLQDVTNLCSVYVIDSIIRIW